MKMILILVTVLISCNSVNNKLSFGCEVSISRERVDFSTCYNGLTINELEIKDPVVSSYPHKYEKVRAYQLVKDPYYTSDLNELKIYFTKPNEYFSWKYFDTIQGHKNEDLYFDLPYVSKKVVGDFFKPNTWYLFNFYNPHFQVFVNVDSSGKLELVKEKLDANF